MDLLNLIRLPDSVRDWFGRTLVLWSQGEQKSTRSNTEELQRQLSSLRTQKDQLLNLNLLGEISNAEFSAKNTEIRDRICSVHAEAQSRRPWPGRTRPSCEEGV